MDAANRFRSRSCDLHLTHAVTLCHPQTPQEVHELLDRTKQEMQAATVHKQGALLQKVSSGSKIFQHVKGACESVQNGTYSAAGKWKRRERSDQLSCSKFWQSDNFR